MLRFMLPLFLGLITLAGCAAKEEVKPEDAPPPPPTAEELYTKLRQPVEPMFSSVASGQPFSNAQRSAAVDGLRAAKAQIAAELNQAQASKKMEGDLEVMIKEAKTKENWRAVKGGIESYKIFKIGEKRYDDDEEYADLMLARPTAEIEGFFELDGETVVFFEITDANTGKKESYKVREGEDFHEVLQLVRIIGRRDAAELMYKPVNQTWTVQAPTGS